MEEATWEREDTMRTTYPFLFKDEGTLFNHLIMKMTVAYACDSMYMGVRIFGRNSLRGEECKTQEKNLKKFMKKKGKTVIC